MKKDYDYIIVGAGHSGLVLAKELTRRNKRVLILEKGRFLNSLGSIWHAFFYYDRHALAASRQGVHIYRIFGVGGTGVVGCGNAITPSDEEIMRIGIDFKHEFAEAKKECFVRDGGLVNDIGKASQRIMDEANKLGYDMFPMPKFSITGKCASCGNCYVGCMYDSKWTSRYCLKDMDNARYDLRTGFSVTKIVSKNGNAIGVEGRLGEKFYGNRIIIAAGGIATPVILQNSGIEAGDNLFVDLYNVTYGISGLKEYNQRKELSMATVCAKFHKDDGFVMAPFIDNWVSFSTTVPFIHMNKTFKLNRLMGIMTKINDDSTGRVYRNGQVDKEPTESDWKKMAKGSNIAKEILIKCGCNPKSIFVTRPSGAHPGGTAGIGRVVNNNLETQMKNLYVCDCSVLPFAPGLPPMLMLIALAKWFGKRV